MEVLELIRYSHVFYPDRDAVKIASDDLLLVKGSANDLVEILNDDLIELPMAEQGPSSEAEEKQSLIVELIIEVLEPLRETEPPLQGESGNEPSGPVPGCTGRCR